MFKTSLSLTLFGAALFNLPQPVDSDPVARLNDCIQQRFLGTRTFGISRVLPNRYHGVVQFQPENAAEAAAVDDLTRKGYQVAWFLAGRHVLDPAPPLSFPARYGLQGPAYMANMTAAIALPDHDELLAECRKAMAAFAGQSGNNGYDVRKGDWVVAMRPLRATNDNCVLCHTVGPGTLIRDDSHRPKSGDALGVAMYVYRHRQ
jgi:hypothetical protein